MTDSVRNSLLGIAAVAIVVPAAPAQAQSLDTRFAFNIPAQPVADALLAFSRQSNIQVVSASADVGSQRSRAVRGTMASRAALDRLLGGTGLAWRQAGGGSIVVESAGSGEALAGGAAADSGSADLATTQDIVVTAQKRAERLIDVPVPVTSLSGQSLATTAQTSLVDYYSRIPGLNLTITDYGPPVLSIRGMTTGNFINPTTGIIVDDVPFANHTAGFPSQAPDIDPGDLASVEVLRGPQGTLYGASSMGGLLKYVTAPPSFSGATARVQSGVSMVRNGSTIGLNVRASANTPLTDTFALRVSGFWRRDPGYVDNVLTGQEGINETRAFGGRVSALWQPTSTLSVRINAFHQERESDGLSGVVRAPGLGRFEQSNARGTGATDSSVTVLSGTVSARLGAAELVSVTGYAVNTSEQSYDFTRSPFFTARAQRVFGVPGAVFASESRGRNFTQEVRLTIPIGERITWLVGGFYNHEHTNSTSQNLAVVPITGQVVGVGSVLRVLPANNFTEYAGFTNLTIELGDRFDIQLGARQSYSRNSFGNFNTGPFLAVSPQIRPLARSRDDAFTYLVTPRWRFTDDAMVYARLSSGYRPGGPNVTAFTNATLPPAFAPDTTRNYEVGIKGNFLDRRLTIDASVYYIDWQEIQLAFVGTAAQGFAGFVGNAGPARSQGAEISLEARPMPGLTISAWGAYNDAELTRGVPTGSVIIAAAGAQLPFSSRYSGNVSIDQEFPLTGGWTGFVGGTLSYVGRRLGPFGNSANVNREVFPSYTKADLRLGARQDRWSVNVFVNNLFDSRGLLYGGLQTFDTSVFTYIPPRTIGASIALDLR